MSPDPTSSSGPRLTRTSHHAQHRARQHHEAHDQSQALPAILEHPQVYAGPPLWVKTSAELDRLLRRLRQAGSFAYDTEFIGEHSYHPRLCLVQVATTDFLALLDPLTGLELRSFWELVADPAVLKIVHAGRQDLEPVYRHLGCPGRHLFDVQVAAGFLGQAYPSSLAKLTERFLQVKVGRELKFSQWDRRPLTAKQMHYAADDVRYLPLLHQTLGQNLQKIHRQAWAQAAMAELEDPALYSDDPEHLSVKPREMERLSPREQAILRRLLAWRQKRAQELDVPPRALVDDGVLCAMTYRPIRCVADLGSIRGLPRDVEKLYGRELVETVQRAMADPLPTKPPVLDDPHAHRQLIQRIWASLEDHCNHLGVAINLLGSKRNLSAWIIDLQRGQEAARHPWSSGWRRECLEPWWSVHFPAWGLELPK